jgi:hypothetical protein
MGILLIFLGGVSIKCFFMFIRAPFIFLITLAFAVTGTCLCAERSAVDAYSKQATRLSQQRLKKKSWTGGQQSDLMQQSFPFKQWKSHYSSLGSRRSNISVVESQKKRHFDAEKVKFSTKTMDTSRWNRRIADLERQALIHTDQGMQKIQDRRIYNMITHNSKNFANSGETLSLRDINRFQFRQNRSDAAVPVTQAGSEGR